jgi:hypothetical protein
LEALAEVLNRAVKALYPFYLRNALGMDVIENLFLSVDEYGDRRMPSIDRNILLEPIAVNVAKWLLGSASGKQQLFTRNLAIDEKVPNGRGTVKARKNGKVLCNCYNLSLQGKIWILLFCHDGSNSADESLAF